MNIFVPQSIQTHIELEEIANVKRQLILPKNSTPGIGVVQDGLIGSYNLTLDDTKLDWRTMMNLIASTTLEDLDTYKKTEVTGKDLYSHVLPERVNIDNEKRKIKITNGILEKGVLNKKDISHSSKNNLTQFIWDEYGMESAKDFLNNTIILANNYNLVHGMTVGIDDLTIPTNVQETIYQIIETKKTEAEVEITEIENNPDMLDPETFEKGIMEKIDKILKNDITPLVINNLSLNNNFMIMMNSGSKGSDTNLTQMMGCLGLQSYEGGRIPKNFNSRTLPYYFKNDDRAESRGFGKNSLLLGLDLTESVFQALVAREGLIDSACRTAESGYIQRKLIKSTEDFMVKYDGTVRNAVNKVEQFIYGDSGIDSVRQYEYNFKIISMSDEDIKKHFIFTDTELKDVESFKDNEQFYKTLLYMRDHLRETLSNSLIIYDLHNRNTYMLAVNINRIINNVRNMNIKDKKVYKNPRYILELIDYIIHPNQTKLYAMSENEMKNVNSIKYQDDYKAKTVFRYALYEALAPKRCIYEYKFSKEQLDLMASQIIKSFNKGVVDAGEMVGILSAQSIGEPVSQLMLKAFHKAGISGQGGQGLGVGRIREVLSVSENIKEPIMKLYFNKKYNNKIYTNKVLSYIKYTTLAEIRTRIDVYYDPDPYMEGGFAEKDNVYNVFKTYHQTRSSASNSIEGLNWLVRVEFDRDSMLNKEVTLLDIKTRFCQEWEKRYDDMKSMKRDKKALLEKIVQIAVASNNDNDEIPIIHFRLDLKDFNSNTFVEFMEIMIDNFKLKGLDEIDGIWDDKVFEGNRTIIGKDGNLEKSTDFIINTRGINFDILFNINGLDLTRTTFNDINKIYELFGIEAARKVIISELQGVMANNDAEINYQHISIYGDLMTNTGNLTSIDRHGLNKLDTDPFSRASFEKPVEQLMNAALFNETDYMKSVSSRIMAGLCIKGGTGLCEVVMDRNMLENSEYTGTTVKNFTKLDDVQTLVESTTDVFIPDF